jgi:uncharacterized membrane protein
MFDLPFHPFLTHMPLALSVVTPILGIVIYRGIRQGYLTSRTWWIVVGLQGFLCASAYLCNAMGERDEAAVKTVVATDTLKSHKENGERFVWACGVVFALGLISLILKTNDMAKLGFIYLGLTTIILAFMVGHSGGSLVYLEGAAAVYQKNPLPSPLPLPSAPPPEGAGKTKTPEEATPPAE